MAAGGTLAGATQGESSARQRLEQLVSEHELRLVSRPGPARPALGLTWSISRRGLEGEPVTVTLESGPAGTCAVVREEGRVFCYVTEGLFLTLDPQRPGTVLFSESMEFLFAFKARDDGAGMLLEFRLVPANRGSVIDVDVSSILRGCLESPAVVFETEPKGGTIRIGLANANIRVEPARANASGFPLSRFTLSSPGGGSQSIGHIWVGHPPSASAAGLTGQRLQALPLQQVPIAEEDLNKLLAFPPRGFWSVPANRAASELLTALVDGRRPASQPGDPAAGAAVAPEKQEPRPEPAGRFDSQRAETRLFFQGLQRALSDVAPSPRQLPEIEAFFAIQQARYDELIDSYERQGRDPGSLRTAMVVAGEQVLDGLRDYLSEAQYSRFAAAWLAKGSEIGQGHPFRRALGILAAGLLELDLPDKERQEAVDLLWDAWHRMERLRGQLQVGELTEGGAIRQLAEANAGLPRELRRVLGPDLYRELDEYVQRHADPRLLRPRTD